MSENWDLLFKLIVIGDTGRIPSPAHSEQVCPPVADPPNLPSLQREVRVS